MNNVKVEMTIQENGRWYRFVQCKGDTWYCAKCVWHRECFGEMGDTCPIADGISKEIAGYFERFRPVQELVRIGVRLITRKAKQLYPIENIDCRCPEHHGDADNRIYFCVHGIKWVTFPEELLVLIDRLIALGIRF